MAVDVAVSSVNLDHLYAKTREEKSLDNVNDILLGSLKEWSADEDDLFSTLFSIGDDKTLDMIVESPRSDSSSSDSYLTPISPDSAYLSPDDSFVPSPSETVDPNSEIGSTTSSDELPTEDNFLIDMNIDWSSFSFPDEMFDIKHDTSDSDLTQVTSSFPVSTTMAVKVEDATPLIAVSSTTPTPDAPSICAPTTTSSCKATSLVLSAEEKRLLQAEGVVLPTDTTLTKAEEKVLKKVRRKIKNKQSAQESRKKKKCYVDGLELRVKACTDENRNLQDKVKLLENQNKSLLQQLKQLQAAIANSHPNRTQAGTCLMVLMLAFGLVFFPVNNIWSPDKSSAANYASVNVRSRTLLQVNDDYLQAEEGLGTGTKYSSVNVSDVTLDTKLVSPVIDNALSDINFKVVSHDEAEDATKETMQMKTEKR